jgi:putative DNA primase/helicase
MNPFAEWQRTIAAAPDNASRIEAFRKAVFEISKHIGGNGMDKGEAVDRLDDMAGAHADFGIGRDGVGAIIAEHFERGERAREDEIAAFEEACRKGDEQRARARTNGKAREPPPHVATIEIVTMSDVAPQPIEWVWPGRVARRKLTLIAGDPDLGKSQVGLDISARISTGSEWPDGGYAPLGRALILSAEDAIDDTLRPRLEAAGANLDRVHAVRSVLRKDQHNNIKEATFSLQVDLDALGQKILELGDVQFVMIDPITAYLGDKLDTHQTAAVRSVMAMCDRFGHKYNVAVFGVTHPPKSVQGSKAIHAVTGSLAFVAAARIVLLAIKEDEEPDGRKLLLPVKNNIAARPDGLAYRLVQRIVSREIVASYAVWESGPVTKTANEALADAAESAQTHNALREAKQFLRDVLSGGPMLKTAIEDAADGAGISERTLRRAKTDLRIIAEKQDFTGPWQWRLP